MLPSIIFGVIGLIAFAILLIFDGIIQDSRYVSNEKIGGNKKQKKYKHQNKQLPLLDIQNINNFEYNKSEKIEYPLYSKIITLDEVKQRALELPSIIDSLFVESNDDYKLIAVNTKTNLINNRFRNEPLKFVSKWEDTKKYDNLALYFTEEQLLDCSTTYYRSLRNNFSYFGEYLYIKSGKPNLDQFRDVIYNNIKSCHNFRCTLAAKFYNYFDASSILDFSSGWGDRLFAACSLNKKYLGIDPNQKLSKSYQKIVQEIGNLEMQTVIQSGAEYLPLSLFESKMDKLNINKFDLLFTSPPYFDYEIYTTGPQSVNSYTITYEKWLVDFLFYVLMKYQKYIKNNGYMVLYIQDTDNHNYIEPIVLFMSILNIEYLGIISANTFPAIIFQKTNSISIDNPKKLLKTNYPIISKLADQLLKIGYDNIHYDVVIDIQDNFVFDTTMNSSLGRALFKLIMTLPTEIDTIVWYGTKAIGTLLTKLHHFCLIFGIKLIYCVAKNELGWKVTEKTKEYYKMDISDYIQNEINKGMELKQYNNKNASISVINFLENKISKEYSNKSNILTFPLAIFDNENLFYLIDSIKEMLLLANIDNIETFDKTIFISIATSEYLQALYLIYPKANFYVLVTGIKPYEHVIQKYRTKIIIDREVSLNTKNKKYINAINNIANKSLKNKLEKEQLFVSAIYYHFSEFSKSGDICFLYR